jgi:hypothetical protein
VLKELKIADTVLRPADLLDRVSRWKSRAVRADTAMDAVPADADDSWTLAAAGYRRYQTALKTAGAVDFDDLLLLVDELFTNHEDVRRAEAGRFDHVLTMDRQNLKAVRSLAGGEEATAEIGPLTRYCRRYSIEEVPDPYYGGEEGFDRVLDLLEDACAGLLETLKAERAS